MTNTYRTLKTIKGTRFEKAFKTLNAISNELNLDTLIVGATVKEILLESVNHRPARQTLDVDITLELQSWDEFEALEKSLLEKGFESEDSEHRFVRDEEIIDIVPFGDLESPRGVIAWPKDKGMKMNVQGFEEALAHCDIYNIEDEPEIEIKIASLAGFCLLKIISWGDRGLKGINQKDLEDFYEILKYSELIFSNEIYELDSTIWEELDHDQELVAAFLVGVMVNDMASDNSKKRIEELISKENRTGETLMILKATDSFYTYEKLEPIFNTFKKGYSSSR